MKITFIVVLIAALCSYSLAQSGGFLSSNIEATDSLASLENFENGENDFPEEFQEGLIISEEENEIDTNGDYILLSKSETSGNSDIEMMLYYSTQYIIQEGITKQILLPDTYYFISQVFSIEVQADNKENYRVNLQISDEKNNTANATYLVSYQAATGTINVTSYSLTNLSGSSPNDEDNNQVPVPDNSTVTDNNGTATGDFIPLDMNEVGNNVTILMIGVTGIDYVVTQAIQSGLLPDGYYDPTAIYTVGSQTVENGVNYLWDVQVSDYSGNSAELVFIAFFDPVSYDVQVVKSQVLNIVRV